MNGFIRPGSPAHFMQRGYNTVRRFTPLIPIPSARKVVSSFNKGVNLGHRIDNRWKISDRISTSLAHRHRASPWLINKAHKLGIR